jgi:hypothetical protein
MDTIASEMGLLHPPYLGSNIKVQSRVHRFFKNSPIFSRMRPVSGLAPMGCSFARQRHEQWAGNSGGKLATGLEQLYRSSRFVQSGELVASQTGNSHAA